MDDWAAQHGIQGTPQEKDNRYRFHIRRTQDLQRFFSELKPYIYDREEQVELLLEEIIPQLQSREYHESREKFIELVEIVDEFREQSATSRDSKYDVDYFRDNWSM